MLIKFEVENFKNFDKKLILDLTQTNNYEFNSNAVKNGIVKTGIIYGENGSGKTNLGYAIFDIILHLVDKQKNLENYSLYQNLNSGGIVKFKYTFKFDDEIVEYSYTKLSPQELLKETLLINDKIVLEYDYNKHESILNLKGAEHLNKDISEKNISFVKYVNSNTVLTSSKENLAFAKFIDFVENMLMFSSLDGNIYQGFIYGVETISEGIINRGHLKDFQIFLESVGIKYTLFEKNTEGKKEIFCKFGDKEVNFFSVASRGTRSLALFYYWLIQLEKVSFVFLDEFDAFYHSNLSEKIVCEILKLNGTQALFTTHNTEIMTNDLLRPDCYLQIKDGTIKSFANSTRKELRRAHNLRKLYEAGTFND